MEINDRIKSYNTAAAGSSANSTSKTGSTDSNMDISDFFQIMAAQLQNQDMYNTVSDTEFISQMAQFTSLETMQKLSSIMESSVAISYVGKNVHAIKTDDSGRKVDATGTVQRVTFIDGKPKLYINDMEFDPSDISEVYSTAPAATSTTTK